MTLRLTYLHFAAVALAMATFSLAGSSARAFTFEDQSATNADGSKFADPDDQVKNFGNGLQLGQGGPLMQFGAGPTSRFGGPGAGFASPPPPPPDPYSRPPGFGD